MNTPLSAPHPTVASSCAMTGLSGITRDINNVDLMGVAS